MAPATSPFSSDLPSDEELTRRVSLSDARAFDALFARHGPGVYGFLLRMTGGAALSEDLTQETFLRFWRARQNFAYGRASLQTYLFTIARRLLLDVCKRPHYNTTPWDDFTEASLRSLAPGPEQTVLAGELAETLEAALAALPPPLREATLLREVEGLDYEQIAAIVNCPLGTVKSRLNTARVRLRAAVRTYLTETPDA